MDIDRRSPLPLYQQLKQLLDQEIRKGVWKPGEQLPTEEEIQHEYQISRTTVRLALRDLEVEGRINRQPGRGTFVAQPKVREGTEPFNVTASEFVNADTQLSWKVLSAEWEQAPDQAASALQIARGEQVFCLRRLRLSNYGVIGITTSFVPSQQSQRVDLALAEQGGSMKYLKGISLQLCNAERIVEALAAEHRDAKVLEIEEGAPVLVITRVLSDCDGQPIEFFRGVYRGDRFQYHVESLPAQI